MGTLNVRLPDELTRSLEHEAKLSHRPRSELAREAIREYLERLERERYLGAFVAEAKAVYGDRTLRADAHEIAREMSVAEAEASRPSPADDDAGEDWWR